ncbi:hypothetical protein [Rheinheimera maricola]|uniref:Uncharacterized protein n=1 Tax=Rheinheimera maricola TaxID=2793282 RepID=A0ABS7X5V1_9GAMM|nr:hypothetical protein [Rheinheimera maricola]MBZ9610921.1 hypothetical protein [Rheinheimera maricola]
MPENNEPIESNVRLQILMSGWSGQMNAIWHIHQHVSLAEAASASAWFLLYTNGHINLASALMLFMNVILIISFFSVKRHYQIQDNFDQMLRRAGIFDSDPKPQSALLDIPYIRNWSRLFNHELARLLILVVIIVNLALGMSAAVSSKDYLSLASIFTYINGLLTLHLLYRWRELIAPYRKVDHKPT